MWKTLMNNINNNNNNKLIVIVALATVTKGLVQGLMYLKITGRVKTIQTTVLLRSARILRSVLETWGDLLSLKLEREQLIRIIIITFTVFLSNVLHHKVFIISYLPTPPPGQDITQGQFFKRSLTGLNSEFCFS